jgi:hypothetical protein
MFVGISYATVLYLLKRFSEIGGSRRIFSLPFYLRKTQSISPDLAEWLEPLSKCRSCNCPGFDPSILRHSGIRGAADEAALNIVHKKKQSKEIPL